MPLKEWLFTNMTIRNMLADFGFRNGTSRSKKFTEYFAYKLEKYQEGDFWLYFPEQPFWEQYKNEAFNKLREIDLSSVPKYLEFHLAQFADKKDFLLFVKNEIKDRLTRLKRSQIKVKLEAAREWVLLKEEDSNVKIDELKKDSLISEIHRLLTEERKDMKPDFEKITEEIKNLISEKQSGLAEVEQRVSDALYALPSGKIELGNPQLQDKLVELLFHLSNVQSADKRSNDGLFKTFSQADITSLLKTHFVTFKPIKYSTVQKNVGEVVQAINWKNPSLAKLNNALEDFFYK